MRTASRRGHEKEWRRPLAQPGGHSTTLTLTLTQNNTNGKRNKNPIRGLGLGD